MKFALLLTTLVTIFLAACGRATADDRLYASWHFSSCSYDDMGKFRESPIIGEIHLDKGGQFQGQRKIGSIYGPLDGAFTVGENRLSLKAEPDITYTWAISESDIKGTPVWILALDNGSMTYQLIRPR